MIQLLFKKETYFALGGVLLFLGGIYLGYKVGIGKYYAYQLEVAQAVTEQRNRNEAANQVAKEKEALQIETIEKLHSDLEKIRQENSSEAAKESGANDIGLSRAGSLRVNKVTVPKSDRPKASK